MAGKASIVTGGAQGIGKAFAGVLLEDGYKVSVSVYYRPPTTFRERSVISLSVHRAVPCDHYPWYIGPQGPRAPSHQPQTCDITVQEPLWPPASDIWWPRLVTCLNLFTWGPPSQWHLVVTEACTVGNQTTLILLECFLILFIARVLSENE